MAIDPDARFIPSEALKSYAIGAILGGGLSGFSARPQLNQENINSVVRGE
jgi:hypothetical protein